MVKLEITSKMDLNRNTGYDETWKNIKDGPK